MGCSPSKGHRWNDALSSISDDKALTAVPPESDKDRHPDDRGSCGTASQMESDGGGGRSSVAQKVVLPEERGLSLAEVASGVCTALGKVSAQAVEVNLVPRGKETQDPSVEENQGKAAGRRPRNGRGSKQGRQKDKDKKAAVCELKVDFPEPMVKAHQAAYAYLNPSISKYEALLALLDQAAHTQLSLQPMVAFMVLRYEEVTCGLEDMAAEGEQMLKEHRDHLAWPCPLKNHTCPAPGKPEDRPPDLMQQLLQYSTERMRLVGDSVGGLGDSTLEEAADYFSSLSELLDERLKAKRVAEGRLAQVIAHIEGAAYRKPVPEDSALHSEDSGIGAESESLAGSERHRHRCESCESAGTTCPKCSRPCDGAISTQRGAGGSKRAGEMSPSFSLNSLDAPCASKEQTGTDYTQGSEDDDEDENDDDDGDEDEEEGEKKARRRSNSSPPDPSQLTRHLATTRIENPQNVEMTFKMKDAISGRIHFVPSQHPIVTSKRADSLGNGALQWTEEGDWQPRRPQTASSRLNEMRKKPSGGKQRRSRSAESLRSKAEDPTLLELERTQRHLSWRLERMSKGEKVGGAKGTATLICGGERPEEVRQLLYPRPPVSSRLRSSLDRNFSILPNHDITGLRTHSFRDEKAEKEEKEEEKKKDGMVGRGPLRANIQPSTPLLSKAEPSTFHRGRNSVKRLIDTFSQRDDKQHQGPSNIQGSFCETRNCGVHITLSTGNRNASVRIINGNNNNSCVVDRPEDLNVDNLPPPPPEVLMDNSFECVAGLLAGESGGSLRSRGRVTSRQLRSSLPTVTALPSCGNLRRSSLSLSSARPVTPDAVAGHRSGNDALQPEVDPESEEAATLYRQARKVIHLRHAAESPVKKPLVDLGPRVASVSLGSSVPSEIEAPTPYANIQPPTTPPASRARLPPCSTSNRRLPNPPSFKRQPTPPAPGKPPTPPPGQVRRPSPRKLRQEEAPGSNSASCSVKATSPSASPRVERWTRPSSPSQSFSDARSVFCHASHSPSGPPAWTTLGSCALPQPWGKPSSGGLQVSMRGPQPFVRRSQCDRRPSLTLQPQPPEAAIAAEAQSSGSEPNIGGQKLELRPAGEDAHLDSQ
ncbi:hypothetical protein AAFF_G00254240 [Aldrovandia affinis]|uniref:Photoreceptor cilium actin regulator n=1 Tax=Aldrovandia affinis TaxID=143900 RepID=A0AAD7W357_9TELE|nr:hypothetical protein AAFF_G00254240 [Aldrovandia affinis]